MTSPAGLVYETEFLYSVSTMQLHDAQGKRLYLTADERRAFIAAAAKAECPVRTFCAVLHDTGRRISEALALTPERIDLTGRAIVFEPLTPPKCPIYWWRYTICLLAARQTLCDQ
jgi:integrase